MSRGQKSLSPALELVGRVLREQGLGRHIDEDFITAATTEMQEAMGMSPEEFESAAAALLAAETDGGFRWTRSYKKSVYKFKAAGAFVEITFVFVAG